MNKEKKAIKGSIKKWQKIVAYLKCHKSYNDKVKRAIGRLERGAQNCPLCALYSNDCITCPVVTRGKALNCGDTPFDRFGNEWAEMFYGKSLKVLTIFAKKEVKFLKSLL